MSDQRDPRDIVERLRGRQHANKAVKGEMAYVPASLADEAADLIEQQAAELARLRETVERLPHFHDGKPAVPGAKVYPLHPIETPEGEEPDHGVLVWALRDPQIGLIFEHGYGEFCAGMNFSSPEAAAEAREAAEAAAASAEELGGG